MLRINLLNVVLLSATLLAVTTCILGQKYYRKPWPMYSLQNMPETRFTCQDKILGGYYGDAETQCQMFHVCVKVAGVGVQDFRFLCPNGTAFDQEAQICADWGDVDCDQSVLYYGSDNFDLYRLGSGFESKRAPLAEEEESTFHLQRAESGDIRRSKETRVDQKSRPQQPPNYAKHFESTTGTLSKNYAHNDGQYNDNYNINNNNNNNSKKNRNKLPAEEQKRPLVNYYTPTKTTTTTTTTERYNDDSKQDFDEIFKGSHSSNFFANRNGGREDDFIDQPSKARFNDFNDFSRKPETSTAGKTRVPTTKRQQTSSTTTTTTTTPKPPKSTKKVSSQPSYNTEFFNYSPSTRFTPPNSSPTTTTTSTVFRNTKITTPRPNYSNANRFSLAVKDYQTQENIQATTYNPANSVYRLKLTTPKYTDLNRDNDAFTSSKSSFNDKPTKSAPTARKVQKQKLDPRNSTFVNQNEFSEFTKINLQQPQPFQPAKTTENTKVKQSVDKQFFRSRTQQQVNPSRVGYQEPAPFTTPQKQADRSNKVEPTKASASVARFAPRGSINYKGTTQRAVEPPSPTITNDSKKFSTLVSRDLYTPTTFKPTTYQKANDYNFYQTQQQQTVRPANNKQQKQQSSTKITTTAAPTTANQYTSPDEDDGQYHPELYEIDFPRNRLTGQRLKTTAPATATTPKPSTTITTKKSLNYNNVQNPTTHLKTQQQTSLQKQQEQSYDLSEEDELFKTAQSLNFGAASINKLRADIFKAEKTSQQYNSQYSPNPATTSSPTTTTTRKATTNFYAYSTAASTTQKPYTTTYIPTTTTTTTTAYPTTTRRPYTAPTATTTTTTTQRTVFDVTKSGKKPTKSKGKNKKTHGKSSKRPLHADEDTSYDYAYYDSDTLSESPQDYPEYEIAEFSKTRKN